MNTDDIKIRENTITSGFSCDFYVNNKKFYADVSYTIVTCEPECMIFKYKKDDEIDWRGVYHNRDVTVSEESLLKCIKEFAEKECGI